MQWSIALLVFLLYEDEKRIALEGGKLTLYGRLMIALAVSRIPSFLVVQVFSPEADRIL